MTTAKVFAEHCGLTPESATWAYGKRYFYDCRCGKDCYDTACEDDMPECSACGNAMQYAYSATCLTATSPLAPSPTPGWLESFFMRKDLRLRLLTFPDVYDATAGRDCLLQRAAHPTHAVALTLIAADPALRAACEACEDWHNYEELK